MKKAQLPPPAIGEIFTVSYPFVRDTYEDFDGEGTVTVQTWKPGIRHEQLPPDGADASYADGMGSMLLTVVGVYKPEGYPLRVFFTRRWCSPDGKQFGKGKLHIRSQAQFRALTRGYRHRFEMSERAA